MNKLQKQFNPKYFNYLQAEQIQKGSHCMLDGQPCKIIQLVKKKAEKYDNQKILFIGINIFNNDKQVQYVFSANQKVLVPIIKKWELQVFDISEDDFVTFINPDHSLKQDLKLPSKKQQKQKFRDIFESNKQNSLIYFTIIQIYGNESIIQVRLVKI